MQTWAPRDNIRATIEAVKLAVHRRSRGFLNRAANPSDPAIPSEVKKS
jgi:hypothetical protein